MKWILIFTLLICFGYSTFASAAEPDSKLVTSAEGRLVDDINRDLKGDHNMFHPECKFKRVLAAQPLSKDEKATYEQWDIEACKGKSFSYRVMIIRGNGSNSVMISPLDAPQ